MWDPIGLFDFMDAARVGANIAVDRDTDTAVLGCASGIQALRQQGVPQGTNWEVGRVSGLLQDNPLRVGMDSPTRNVLGFLPIRHYGRLAGSPPFLSERAATTTTFEPNDAPT